jgi:hypothetical protein
VGELTVAAAIIGEEQINSDVAKANEIDDLRKL